MKKLAIVTQHLVHLDAPCHGRADVNALVRRAVINSGPPRISGRPHTDAARDSVVRCSESGLTTHEARRLLEAEPRLGGAARRTA